MENTMTEAPAGRLYRTDILAAKAVAKALGDKGDQGGWIFSPLLGKNRCQGWSEYARWARLAGPYIALDPDEDQWFITKAGRDLIEDAPRRLKIINTRKLAKKFRDAAEKAMKAAVALEQGDVGKAAWEPEVDFQALAHEIADLVPMITWDD
jgi:hypothetical protein